MSNARHIPRRADDVAGGEDARGRGLEVPVHADASPAVRLDAGLGQSEPLDVPGAPHRVEDDLWTVDLRTHANDQAPGVPFDGIDLRLEDEPRPGPLQAVRQGFRHLGIQERHQPGPPVHQRDLHAERGEDRRVLGADGPAADDHHALGQLFDGQDCL
jgi:hypothetical protein